MPQGSAPVLNLGEIVVDHGDTGGALFDGEDVGAGAAHGGEEGVAAVVELGGEGGEVGGEALAQPGVVPILFSNGIAEPLVGGLVGYEAEGGTIGDAAFAVEDGAGVLHAAAHAGHLDVGEFFVREGADVGGEELDGLARGIFEGEDAVVAVLREDPGFERHAGGGGEMARGEGGDADIVQPAGDGHGLLPMGHAAAIAEIEFLNECAVGDDLISRGRGDQKLAGGLVGGVIDHGQPLAREGRPVPAEEGAVAELVLGDVQAVAGDAVILHGEDAALAGRGGGIECDGEAIGGVLEFEGRAVRGDRSDGHALAVLEAGQIEHDLGDTALDEAEVDGGLAGDLIVGVGESDAEDVVLGIDAGLARSSCRRKTERRTAGDTQR